MRISVASGKGGTGKTMVATNLALSIKNQPVQLLDCDVEEPNAHIFFQSKQVEQTAVSVQIPEVDEEKCVGCGKCSELCVFNAITNIGSSVLTFEEMCHSCGVCWNFCPAEAIKPKNREIGLVTKAAVDGLTLVTGKLNIGSHISPPVIKAVKQQCLDDGINILDGPPGSSCPVMTTVENTDFCVLVTEPTPFGLNDLKLAHSMIKVLGVPCGVVINRDGPDSVLIEKFCRENDLNILMRIPLDIGIARSYSKGVPLVKDNPSWQEKFYHLYQAIKEEVQE